VKINCAQNKKTSRKNTRSHHHVCLQQYSHASGLIQQTIPASAVADHCAGQTFVGHYSSYYGCIIALYSLYSSLCNSNVWHQVPCLGSEDVGTQMFCEDRLHRVTFNKQKAMRLHNSYTWHASTSHSVTAKLQ